MRSRPIIVSYRHAYNYVIESVIVLLFIAGVWCGRRSRFMWLVMSWFALDMLLHVVLGFAINEVYIVSAHWMYAIPISVACLMRSVRRRSAHCLKALLMALTAYLWVWNVSLICAYLYAG